MNVMFSRQEQYSSCHSNITFISPRHRVISSIYLLTRIPSLDIQLSLSSLSCTSRAYVRRHKIKDKQAPFVSRHCVNKPILCSWKCCDFILSYMSLVWLSNSFPKFLMFSLDFGKRPFDVKKFQNNCLVAIIEASSIQAKFSEIVKENLDWKRNGLNKLYRRLRLKYSRLLVSKNCLHEATNEW